MIIFDWRIHLFHRLDELYTVKKHAVVPYFNFCLDYVFDIWSFAPLEQLRFQLFYEQNK